MAYTGNTNIIVEKEEWKVAWKHIVIEGYCFYNSDQNKDRIVPQFCINGPDNLGLHCIAGVEGGNERCPYFAFGQARSTVIVTDENGQDFGCNGFYIEDAHSLSEEEYLRNEKEWINTWAKKINKNNK